VLQKLGLDKAYEVRVCLGVWVFTGAWLAASARLPKLSSLHWGVCQAPGP
jgi:hypothetical protein